MLPRLYRLQKPYEFNMRLKLFYVITHSSLILPLSCKYLINFKPLDVGQYKVVQSMLKFYSLNFIYVLFIYYIQLFILHYFVMIYEYIDICRIIIVSWICRKRQGISIIGLLF